VFVGKCGFLLVLFVGSLLLCIFVVERCFVFFGGVLCDFVFLVLCVCGKFGCVCVWCVCFFVFVLCVVWCGCVVCLCGFVCLVWEFGVLCLFVVGVGVLVCFCVVVRLLWCVVFFWLSVCVGYVLWFWIVCVIN
jgi:hypothetical protein